MVDNELRWNNHAKYAIAKATKYALMFSRLTRPSTSLSPEFMSRLYIAVAILRLTYAAEVWYLPVHRKIDAKKNRVLAGFTRKMESIQQIAALKITGTMRMSPTDMIEIHAGLLLMSLLIAKVCHRSAMQLAALPPLHLLHDPVRKTVCHNVMCHCLLLHELAYLFNLNANDMETTKLV
ncbi:hypothetical protein J132_10747 [Termitomyces sp. J132]|nr:hypothetical protein J132_10747 [Termitomyces sp. J132]